MQPLDDNFRFDGFDRAITLTLLAFAATACSSDNSTTSPPTPSAISVSSGGAQTATVNTVLTAPVVVEITSANGVPVAGVAVTFTPKATSGAVSSTSVTTDANGLAQVNWTLGTVAGADSLTATAGTLTTVIVATAAAGAATNVAVVSGNDQTATAGSTLSSALTVKVTDAFGNAVSNASVQWSDDAGGTFSTTTTLTDANGLATVLYTLGPSAGTADVMASLSTGGSSPVTTMFTEVAD